MAALHEILPILISLSLAGMVASVGLDSRLVELLSLFRQPARLAKAVLAVNVIVPVAATIVAQLFDIPPIARGAIIVMAVSPVPALVPGKVLKAGAERSYAYSLYMALAFLSVVVVPTTVAILARVYGVSVPLGPLAILRDVAVTVIAPLAVGLVLRRVLPTWAERLSGPLRSASMILLIGAAAPLVVAVWPAFMRLVGSGALMAMGLVVAVALAAGHWLGGPERADRAALAMTAATRHPGIAMMIARAAGADKGVAAAILAFLLVESIVAIPYHVWLKRRRAPAKVAA